jgi:hypothetical protein
MTVTAAGPWRMGALAPSVNIVTVLLAGQALAASPVASAAFTPVFGAPSLIGLIPAYYLFRSLQDRVPGHGNRRSHPGG